MKKLNLDDSVHIEIPINENETSIDLEYFAEIVHEKDVILSGDITSIHPSLQDPFKLEVAIVIQSATKYFGVWSDILAVLISVKTQDMKIRLLIDRIFLGSNVANLETSLLLRSLRTLVIRVRTQAEHALKLVKHLKDVKHLKKN